MPEKINKRLRKQLPMHRPEILGTVNSMRHTAQSVKEKSDSD